MSNKRIWCPQGGIYLLNLVDFSVGGFPLLFIGLIELIAINWVYGEFSTPP